MKSIPPVDIDIDPANLNRKILETIARNKQIFEAQQLNSGQLTSNLSAIHPPLVTTPPAPPPPPRQQRIILTSYMRSGSTLTGELLQSSPDVFYFYEPLLYHNDQDIGPGKDVTRFAFLTSVL